jgi:competence protein ComEA
MTYFTKKEQIIIISLILIVVIISVFNFVNSKFLTDEKDDINNEINVEDLSIDLIEEEGIDENQIIMVHISGEVYKPGIVELNLGSRVIDAVNLAGGLKKDADLDKINLAKKLSDEEKIYIPKIGEEDITIETSNDTITSNDNSLININICTKEELMSLPGIGDVLAGKILDYREQSPFKTIDDIKNVSGIGEKRFESIKEFITVK